MSHGHEAGVGVSAERWERFADEIDAYRETIRERSPTSGLISNLDRDVDRTLGIIAAAARVALEPEESSAASGIELHVEDKLVIAIRALRVIEQGDLPDDHPYAPEEGSREWMQRMAREAIAEIEGRQFGS